MTSYSSREIEVRAVLAVAIAALAYLATNPTWNSLVGPTGIMATGLLAVASQALRSYIDRSSAHPTTDVIAPEVS